MSRKLKHQRDDGGSMFASVVVIVLGTLACIFAAATGGQPRAELAIHTVACTAILLIGWIIWYRYARNRSAGISFWASYHSRHRDEELAAQYRPRKVRDRLGPGANKEGGRPITAEEARQLRQSSPNAWVPARDRSRNST